MVMMSWEQWIGAVCTHESVSEGGVVTGMEDRGLGILTRNDYGNLESVTVGKKEEAKRQCDGFHTI